MVFHTNPCNFEIFKTFVKYFLKHYRAGEWFPYDRCDRWTFFSAIAAILAITWKPGFNQLAFVYWFGSMTAYISIRNLTVPNLEKTMKFKFSIRIVILGFLTIRFAQVFPRQEIVDMGKYICFYDLICICRKLSLLSVRKLHVVLGWTAAEARWSSSYSQLWIFLILKFYQERSCLAQRFT